jgi:hypothetical protein
MKRFSRSLEYSFTLLATAVSLIVIVEGCALIPKSAAVLNVQMPQQSVSPAPPLSKEEILEKYTALKLESAHLLLKVLSVDGTYEPEGEAFLGCRVTAEDARRFASPLDALIEKQAALLRSDYNENPISFARTNGFGSCTNQCTCGLWMKVAQGIEAKNLTNPRVRSAHQRFLKKLKIKSTRQSAQESRACAENQAWFCDSDLRSYLEAHALPAKSESVSPR